MDSNVAKWVNVIIKKKASIMVQKWVFRNKRDENGIIVHNNARLVGQRYNKKEGIDYEETFAPVPRLEPTKKNLDLTQIVHKFTQRKKNFDLILRDKKMYL